MFFVRFCFDVDSWSGLYAGFVYESAFHVLSVFLLSVF